MLDRLSEGEHGDRAPLLTTHALRDVPVAEQLAPGGRRRAQGTSTTSTSTSTDDDGYVAASALSAAQLAAARRQRPPARRPPLSAYDDHVSSLRPGRAAVGNAPASARPLPPPLRAVASSTRYPPRPHISNTVGHFGRRGEPVAGVPPELDPRASNFRLPAPSAASIYSVSVQPPASPPSTVDDTHLLHTGDGADDEERALATPLDLDSALISSEAESLRGLSPPLISPSSQRVTLSPGSIGPVRSNETPGRRTSLLSGVSTPGSADIPSSGTGQPTRAASATGSGYNPSLYPLRSTRFAPEPASAAATAGSELDSRSMVTSSVWSYSRPSSPTGQSVSSFEAIPPVRVTAGSVGDYQDTPGHPAEPLSLTRARSISLRSESTASSSYGVGSAHSGTDSPYGDRGTSFAGTSIGAASIGSGIGMGAAPALVGGAGEPILEEVEQRTNVSVSVAPSEAGSGADASELNAPPASFASLGFRRRSSLHRAASSIDEEGDNEADSAQEGDTDPDDEMTGGDTDSLHHRATSIGVGSFGASPFGGSRSIPRLVGTNPGDMPLSLSLSFGPGLAAFRSAQPTRAPSTAATAGTASPPRSVASATSESSLKAHRSVSRRGRPTSGETGLAALSDGEYVARSDSELATAGSEESEDEGTDTEPPMQAQRRRADLSYSAFLAPSHPAGWYGSEVDDEGHFSSIPGSWIDIPRATARLSGSDPHMFPFDRASSEYDEHDTPAPPIGWTQAAPPHDAPHNAMRTISLSDTPSQAPPGL